jgi:dipeptidase
MCDTFVHINSKAIIFGKNSDREPNEAQQIVYIPAINRHENTIQTTYITIAYPKKTNAIILSKPFQMWGAEMGCNEHGVVIGNEAVFTKIPIKKSNNGLTGMDLLRIALELSSTAIEAVQTIIQYLTKYGQDACGGYTDKNFYYHNSFIIADKTTAYVLETAGNFWVYQKLKKTFYAISNTLSIETEFDAIHQDAISYAIKKKWAKKNEAFNFSKAFASKLMPKLAASKIRQTCSLNIGSTYKEMKLKDAFQHLRTHHLNENFDSKNSNTKSLCMHASGLFTPHQTTGSMVVALSENTEPTVWLSGAAAPCLSVFMPFYFNDDTLLETNFKKPTALFDDSFWWQSEKWHRKVIMQYNTEIVKKYKEEANLLENHFIQFYENGNSISSKIAISSTLELKNKYFNLAKNIKSKSFLYNIYWNIKNKQAKL